MDFTVTKDSSVLSVSNTTNGLCAVRITDMSDGSTQYKSSISLGTLTNQTSVFVFSITSSSNYMVEAWYYDSSTEKLIPTAIRYV